jgi:antitoxin component YwqK of YwqJK toxin-antitoxin module
MKKLIVLALLLQMFSCTTQHFDNEISCLQLVDRNNLSETISTKEKLKEYEKINFDSSQPYQKVLRIYKTDKNNNTKSILTSYHENSSIHKYLEIENARAHGKYRQWHPNGNLKIDAYVISGDPDLSQEHSYLFDGVCMAYNEEGKKLSEFRYEKGYLQNDTKFFYPSGSLKKIVPYKANIVDGEVLKYSEDSSLIKKTHYKDGKKHGASLGFYNKDNLSFVEEYEEGLLINAKYFKKNRIKICSIKNSDGQKAIFKNLNLHKLIEYKNGKIDGKIQTFNNMGELVHEYVQKNNVKEGIERRYYLRNEVINKTIDKKLYPKLEISWSNDYVHGAVKTWYKNQKMESQKEYSFNKKTGSHFAWYENGSLMFMEEYDNDNLIRASYYKINQSEPISTIINGNGKATLFDSLGRFLKTIAYTDGKIEK